MHELDAWKTVRSRPGRAAAVAVSPRLPSLDLLRGFEAAARLGSFTRAAEALFVTQSAVSRQVQTLEAQLGVKLFERHHRQVRLTEAGQTLHRAAADALRLVAEAADRIRVEGAARSLTVTCSYGFASLWLVPRLMDFRDRHPDIEIRIAASGRLVDLERERVEVAVRYSGTPPAQPGVVRLFGEEVFPVCSPELLARPGRPLGAPADLVHHVLLRPEHEHEQEWPTGSWTVWLEAHGLSSLRPAGTLRFAQYDQLIQAAVDAQGVALGIGPLVARQLRQGRLVAPFEGRTSSRRAYYLLVSRFAAERPEVVAFRDWLLQTVRQERRR